VREADRQSCDRLAALPAAVYTTDEKGAITFYNEAAAELWGARPKLGTSHWCGSWRLCWPDGTPVPHDEWPMTIALKEGRAVRNVEAVIERPDGTRVPCMPYPTPLRDAEDRLVGAINMIIDLTHLKAASERQQLLINELNHRVKNTLATVQSIGYQTFNGKVDAQLQRQFDNRLIALGKTHDVLTQENWVGADLRELLTKSIAFACDADDRATLDGPAIMLPQKTVVPLAMAIHELCTNASKYGALTSSEGRITIDWRLLEDGQRLVLRWVESGGPLVTLPSRRGFGTRLLQRGLAHELRATVDLEFAPSGVTCEIDFRLAARTATH
jgi:PAS domain S-box-containing protein